MKITTRLQLRLWRNLALLGCFFVFLFATNAKISAYRNPAATPRVVSASKMQESAKAGLQVSAATLAAHPNGAALLALACIFAGVLSLRLSPFRIPLHTESSSFLESTYGYLRLLRPPPAR